MKQVLILFILLLGLAATGYAQQDPRDPGEPDSIIVGEVIYDPSDTMFYMPIYAVTDDSVAYYNIPLRWVAPYGGVVAVAQNEYFAPLISWDDNFDSVMLSQSYIRQFGFADLGGEDNPALYTSNRRQHIFTIPFRVAPNGRHQLMVIDTVWDNLNGSLILGLTDGRTEFTPGFKRGFVAPDAIEGTNEPSNFSLSQNYPNPFNPSTTIKFTVPRDSNVRLGIYNIMGQEVRSILRGQMATGDYSVSWDGTDNSGTVQASGTYFYKLTAGDFEETKRMTLLR